MPTSWDPLKNLLSEELHSTLGKLWNSDQDKAFIKYNAEKIAKYVTLYKDPSADPEKREEARFNLDMLQASIAAYAHQKAIVSAQSAEQIAKQVVTLVVGILIKAV